jgi:hypothetical protein
MDYDTLISSAEDTSKRLEILEQLLDELLLQHDGSCLTNESNINIASTSSTKKSNKNPSVTSSTSSSSSSTINVTPIEMVCLLLAWTSMCIGVATATKLEPIHTTMGTGACFVIFITIIFISLSKKQSASPKPPHTSTSIADTVSSNKKDDDNDAKILSTKVKSTFFAQSCSVEPSTTTIDTNTSSTTPSNSSTTSAAVTSSPSVVDTSAADDKNNNNTITPTNKAPFSYIDELRDAMKLDEALNELEKLGHTDTSIQMTSEYLWRKSDILQSQCHWFKPKSAQAIKGYQNAEKYAEMAYNADPNNAKANEVLASVIGINLEFTNDKKKKLDITWRLLDLCYSALKLNPDLYLPYHVIGKKRRSLFFVLFLPILLYLQISNIRTMYSFL